MAIRSVIFAFLCTLLTACRGIGIFASMGLRYVNEEGNSHDIWHEEVSPKAFLSCGMLHAESEQQTDSTKVKLRYEIKVHGPELCELNLNSFYALSPKGDTIPCQTICSLKQYTFEPYSCTRLAEDSVCTLPLHITEMKGKTGDIVVSVMFFVDKRSRFSCCCTSPTIVCYDLEVGERHYNIKSRYRDKWFW